jgi:hypothetical protein
MKQTPYVLMGAFASRFKAVCDTPTSRNFSMRVNSYFLFGYPGSVL